MRLVLLGRRDTIIGKNNGRRELTDRIDVIVNYTPIHVKIKSKLINLMKITRIEGYNGKYGSNLQGNREISYDLFEFDQIGQ